MPAYKNTYTFEVEYLEADEQGHRRRETIEIPYITSSQFFEIVADPAIEGLNGLEFGKWLSERMFPGLLESVSPRCAMDLIRTIFEHEKDTFNLGEAVAPTPESGSTATG